MSAMRSSLPAAGQIVIRIRVIALDEQRQHCALRWKTVASAFNADILPRLFESLNRADSSTTRLWRRWDWGRRSPAKLPR